MSTESPFGPPWRAGAPLTPVDKVKYAAEREAAEARCANPKADPEQLRQAMLDTITAFEARAFVGSLS